MVWSNEEWGRICDVYFNLYIRTCTYFIPQAKCTLVFIHHVSQFYLFCVCQGWVIQVNLFVQYFTCLSYIFSCHLPIIYFGSNITVSCVLLVMFSVALFLMNFNLNITVICSHLSSILTMAMAKISSTKRGSTVMYFCSFGLSVICFFKKNSIDLFTKLKQDSS